jgi:radical SAM superfamily enzyme YgiQ (UPF0313 family)
MGNSARRLVSANFESYASCSQRTGGGNVTVAEHEEIRWGRGHRPGVLIVDREKVAIADLDAGSYRALSIDELMAAEPPELEAVPGAPMPAAVVALEVESAPADPLSHACDHVLIEPLALRLDDRRVLAWDANRSMHCRLPVEHLRALEHLRAPLSTVELAERLGSDPERAAQIVGELARLRLAESAGAPADMWEHVEPPVEEWAADDHGDAVAQDIPDVDEDDPVTTEPRPLPASSSARRLVRRARRLGVRLLRRVRAADSPTEVAAEPVGEERPVADEGAPTAVAQSDPDPVEAPSELLHEVDLTTAVELPGDELPVDDLRDDGERPSTWIRDGRVPVVPLYHFAQIVSVDEEELIEPTLSIGMLFAHARQFDGGRLNERYHLLKVQPDPEAVFLEWAADPVPAIFAFSDYIWNCDRHLDLARRIKELSPESLCLHGGPSSPKYEPDTIEFFEQNIGVDVAARGEGEHTFVEILSVLDGEFDALAVDRLEQVAGITFRRRPGGEIVRTADRERPDDLDQFPSPYLTGEFDDLRSVGWRSASIETNRGCPYGCTFCDWGSATLSRIRKFDLDRVKGEIDWIVANAPTSVLLVSDANFGIFARDVEIVEHVVDLKRDHPHLSNIIFAGVAKNTTKYTSEIYRLTTAAGLTSLASSLAIQTSDEQVLEIVNRKNIKLAKYEELAEQFRELSLPMMTDIIFGLPGSSVETFKNDLQHCFDREITARVFPLTMLPNSPMNEPSYRERYQIRTDHNSVVVSTSTFTEADFQRMRWLRLIYRAADHFGALRHLLRYLQWDHGIRALDLIDRLDESMTARGNRFPLLAFYCRLSDLYTMPPVAWEPFFDEVVEWLAEEYGVECDSALKAVIDLQLALLPAKGRAFPELVRLEHDVLAYRADHRAFTDEVIDPRPLAEYGPLEFEVDDPGAVCAHRIRRNDFLVRRDMESGNLFWIGLDWELASPFARPLFSNSYLFPEKVA